MIYVLVLAFWLSAFLVVYPYVIYPLLLRLLARLSPVRGEPRDGAGLPRVTLLISAYNEEAVIAEKLQNALDLDYPPDSLEVIVVSDASSDRTDEIVQEVSAREPRVRLVRQDERRGKTAGLNKAVETAQGEIVVFS